MYFLDWIDQNCTKCHNFMDIWLKTDETLIQPQFQEIRVGCEKHGKISNQKLYVCNDFMYDGTKPDIVYPEKRAGYWHKRFFVRNGSIEKYFEKKPIVKDDTIDPLTRSIYDLVQEVYQLDIRGCMLSVCVHRLHRLSGMSREAVFREVMHMVETGLLERHNLEGGVFLRPPNPITMIGDIGKRKVLA